MRRGGVGASISMYIRYQVWTRGGGHLPLICCKHRYRLLKELVLAFIWWFFSWKKIVPRWDDRDRTIKNHLIIMKVLVWIPWECFDHFWFYQDPVKWCDAEVRAFIFLWKLMNPFPGSTFSALQLHSNACENEEKHRDVTLLLFETTHHSRCGIRPF